jgi:hypothetical protein
VVRDADGEIMGSYRSQEEADTEIRRLLQEKPYWESLIDGWNKYLDLAENLTDRPQYFARTGMAKALNCFVENAYWIAEGHDPETRLLFIEQTLQDWGESTAIRDFRRAAPGDIMGVQRSSEQIGKFTAHMLSGETDPVRRAAYEAVQILAAVALDSIHDFPDAIGNPFAHEGVTAGLRKLQEAVQGVRESSDTPETGNTRGTIRNMLPS